ncbi:hypothetical protein AOU28_02460 [Pseudomonas aeruginosa]|nr:hypothetical protein AOU28_02460 [Pseudomonas aeruginosa]
MRDAIRRPRGVVALRLGAEQYRAAGDTLLDVEPVAADQGVAVFVEAEVVDQAFLEGTGERQSSEPEVPETSWVQVILR